MLGAEGDCRLDVVRRTLSFDGVRMVRAVRDVMGLGIAAMWVDGENQGPRFPELPDSRLRALMGLASQHDAAAGGAGPRGS